MNKLTLTDIEGFLIKKATRFGNGAKVDCPKQYLGRTIYLVVANEHEHEKTTSRGIGKNSRTGERNRKLKEKVRRP